MSEETYRYRGNKKLRCGYTTGSCSAAAARAAAEILLFHREVSCISLHTPSGIELSLPVEILNCQDNLACCGVRKDSGDDADITNGIMICAEVSLLPEESGIVLDGGPGIGKVTKKGLEQSVGSYAINSVPQKMIKEAVKNVMEAAAYEGGIHVRLSVPRGEEIASKTFNPALGIEGGISILGTTGIVEPMSEKALLDTIALEMKMHGEAGEKYCVITPGNYGIHFVSDILQIDLRQAIKCSNFIGDTIDMAFPYQMEGMLLVGHLGKLVKLGAGIMNTHSRWADGRMEVLCACALEADGEKSLLKQIMQCVTTDEAVRLLKEAGLLKQTMSVLMKKIDFHLKRRCYDGLEIGAVVFTNQHGLLGKTADADRLTEKIKRNFQGGFPEREDEKW